MYVHSPRHINVISSRLWTPSGLHGYSHENPISLSLKQQRDILDHTYNLLTKFNSGIPPKGSVAPWWETSKEGSALLLEKGIEYGMSSSYE